MADTFKFRIDHHGSLVRPSELLTTRAQHAAGEISDEALHEVEDQCVAEAVRQQRNLNLTVVTDGHFRRADPASIVEAVDGFRQEASDDGRWVAVDKLTARRSLLADDTEHVASLTQVPAKATVPSPAALAEQCYKPEASAGTWGSARELGEALAVLVRNEIEQLVSCGVRYVQLDNHGYRAHLFPGSATTPPLLSLADAVAVDAAAVAVADRPTDVRIGLCPAVAVNGKLNQSAAATLFSSVPVDRWVLPFHTGAPAELDLLREVPADRDACLGAVDAANPQLEDIDTVLSRLDAIAGVRDIEDVAVSPNQGFADQATNPLVDTDTQWRKLTHVETLARMFWGNEL